MDEQREWIRSRRKKRLRFIAVVLCFCLLVTSYPDILATLSAFATEQKDGTVYVSGFGELPEAVRVQTVPLGTEQGGLSLPDTLEAFAETESTNPSEETDPPGDSEEGNEEQPEKSEGEEEEQPGNPEGEDGDQPENPEEEGTNPPEDSTGEQGEGNGDTGNPDDGNGDNTGESDDGTGETDGGSDSGEDVEQSAEEEKDDIAEPDAEQEEDSNDAETEPQNDSALADEGVFSVQRGVFVIPVYMAEPVVTVETQTLERKEETIMIKGVIWQPEPAYDGNVEGTYIFTAVLPEGYALTEGVSLPQITVTVQGNDEDAAVQALLARITSLPDVQEYMEKEPDIDNWEGDEDAYEEAYEEWMEELSAYVEEALAIWEEYEALTTEQQAQIPEEALQKLTAWVGIAEQFAGSRKVMAAADGLTDIEGSNLQWKLENGTLTISGTGDMPDWNIESMPWYDSKSSITKVVIENGVTGIGEFAFYNFSSVKSVTIPGSVTRIGYRAFNVSGITSVTIPSSVTSINSYTFAGCRSLTSVEISHGVKEIGSSAFSGCSSLTSVTIPGSVTSIGSTAFMNCSLLTSVEISHGVKEIGSDAFNSCSGLTSVTIPSSVTSIGRSAFNGCSGLTSVTIPGSVTSIGSLAFVNCTSLESVTFEVGNTIPTLGDEAFQNCSCATGDAKGILIPTCKYLTVNGWQQYKDHVNQSHSLTKVDAKPATCVTTGISEHWECTSCDSLFSDEAGTTNTTLAAVTTEKLAHNYTYSASGAVITESCDLGCAHSATATLSIENTSYTYTGDAIKPATVSYSDGWAGSKPAVSYTDNINVGTATATLTISGATASKTFTISSAAMSGVSASGYTGTYDAAAHGITVTAPTGATVEYGTTSGSYTSTTSPTYTNVGTKTVYYQVKKDNYTTVTGSEQVKITACDIKNAVVTLGSNLTYNGAEQTQTVSSVKVGSRTVPTTDYTVSDNKKTDAGTYTLTITGKGSNHTGTVTKQFTIARCDISGAVVTLGNGLTYNGATQTQTVTSVTLNGKTLIAETDYTVSGNTGTEAKTYTLTITGKGNYTGTVTKTFTIERCDISDAVVTLGTGLTYNGATQTQTVTSVTLNGKTLIAGTDYTVNGNTGTNAGPYTLTITGEGNYTGTATKSFTIAGKPLTGDMVTLDSGPYEYTGQAITPVVTVTDGNKTLVSGTDYTVSYTNNTNIGTDATVKVTGKGNYTGTVEVKFVIRNNSVTPPDIKEEDLDIGYEGGTITLPDGIKDEVEIYRDPDDPEGSMITPNPDGSLPVEPGDTIYIRYKEKDETNPASEGIRIEIPGRPAAPEPVEKEEITVTDTAIKVPKPDDGKEYEYVLVEKGQEPDWSKANETGEFTDLDPNKEYDLYVREKATEDSFASEPAKTEIRTSVKEPETGGEGAGKPGNDVSGGEPGADGKVTYTGTYGKEYTPVIKVGNTEYTPAMTWNENSGEGKWTCTVLLSDDVTVEFRNRKRTGVKVTPGTLSIYADDNANKSIEALIAYLKSNCVVKVEYDNKTSDDATGSADYSVTGFIPDQKSAIYECTVALGDTSEKVTLTVNTVTAAVKAPDALTKKTGGYTNAEVQGWLPKIVAVTYQGSTTRTENVEVTWKTDSIGADFGTVVGNKTISGTVALPAWATGDAAVSIDIKFVDKTPLKENEMTLTISGGAYGTLKEPDPKGSVTVKDTDQTFTYRYRADDGNTWVDKNSLPKSTSGYIIPGTYTVEMTYTGKNYMGTKTASFTVVQKPVTVGKGTLAVENRNYDGTTNAKLKEGGVPELSGVIAGDAVAAGGTLSAVFANKGPKKDIDVKVSGFELTGSDAKYYYLINQTLTLKATINNEDGTAPSSGSSGGSGNSGGSGDNGNGGSSGDSSGSGDNGNGGSTGDGGGSGDSGNSGDGGGSGDNGNGGSTGGSSGSGNTGTTTGGGTENGSTGGTGKGSTESGSTGGSGKGSSGSGSTSGTGKGSTGSGGTGGTGKGSTGSGGTSGTGKGSTGTDSTSGTGGSNGDGSTGNGAGAGSADASGQDGTVQAGSGQQTENETVQIVQAAAEDGRIVSSDETAAPAMTGNLTEDSPAETRLMVGDGTVIVEVASADGKYTAGAKDVLAVANAVLTPEQIALADSGETIEVRVDIRDISDSMSLQDKETVEKGYEAYGQYLTDLKLGAYVDISVYIRTGDSGWNAVTETREPIEIVIGIPEELRGEGREYYVIRAHEGRHDLLNDMDDVPETITIITDMFSSYVIAYRLTGTVYSGADMVRGGVDIVDGRAVCRLCHICPTFRGTCCFIWLMVIVAVVTLVLLILSLVYVCITYSREQRRERNKFS